MILAAQNPVLVAAAMALFLLIPFVGWWFMYRAEWRHRPTRVEVGHVPDATFRVGARIGSISWSAPLARVSTYDEFVVVAALGAKPIVLQRADRVRVHVTRPFLAFGSASIELQPARKQPRSRVAVFARPRDVLALESALRRSLDPVSASSG